MSIVLVTGSYPPDICGVGDYTEKLYTNAVSGIWKLCYIKKWAFSSFFSIIRKINKLKASTLVLQYPTEGYGWSIIPHLVALYYSFFTKKQFIVVLHEFSNMSLKAKMAAYLFFLSNKIIFTTNFERENAIKKAPWIRGRSYVINIISNIEKPIYLKKWEERPYDIVYFGHLRPNKGLEDYFDSLEKLYKEYKDIKICVIGQVLPQYEDYFNELKAKYTHLNINYFLNQDSNTVTELLNKSKVCFLPFPDGLSERRGSFLAAISCGALVVSYSGKYMTQSLRKISHIVTLDSASKEIAKILKSGTEEDHKKFLSAYARYLNSNLPKDWIDVVERYENVMRI